MLVTLPESWVGASSSQGLVPLSRSPIKDCHVTQAGSLPEVSPSSPLLHFSHGTDARKPETAKSQGSPKEGGSGNW